MKKTNPTCQVEATLLDADNLSIANLQQLMNQWASIGLIDGDPHHSYAVNFQFMSKTDIQQLNHDFRQKNKPTNVLTFPANTPFDPNDTFIGDIAICLEILKEEAEQEQKTLTNHLAHLVIHSILHSQGYDHQNEQEAEAMETKEIQLLDQLGISNPYQ